MSLTPTAREINFPGRKPFINTIGAGRDEVTLDANTVDSGNTPTTVLRRGLVVAKKTGLNDWIDAADALANVNTVASLLSDIDVDGTWTGETITVTLNGGHFVSFAIVGATAAALKAELEAVAEFAANYTATVVGSAIRIDSRAKGADQLLEVTVTTIDAYGNGAGAAGSAFGAFGEFGITENVVDMIAIDGQAQPMNATIVKSNARVLTDRLTSLTNGARRALEFAGVKFE